MTPKKRMQKFMEIAREKGFLEMATQMNEEELELLIRSLTPEPNALVCKAKTKLLPCFDFKCEFLNSWLTNIFCKSLIANLLNLD